MLFKDLIGLEAVSGKLSGLLEQNRLSHALLFLGKEGNGALTLALAFSQYIVCENVQRALKSGEEVSLFGADEPIKAFPKQACGVCSACSKAASYIHPDIHYSFPVISKKSDKPKSTDYYPEWREFIRNTPYGNVFDWLQSIEAENKQGNISTFECEDIIRKFNLKTFESEYRILIMWMPEYLTKQGNKLLKLIEEPPENTLIIFVAEDESRILPTILSRTQLVKIPSAPKNAVIAELQENHECSPEQATIAANLANGNIREAIQLAHHLENNWLNLVREWLNAVAFSGPSAQVKWIDNVADLGREKQKQFILYLIHLHEQAIRLHILGIEQHEGDEAEIQLLEKLCQRMGIHQLEAFTLDLENALYYVERNCHPKMLFHALTIKLRYILSGKSLILDNSR